MEKKHKPIRKAKKILIFDNSQILIAIVKSLRRSSIFTQCNIQSISYCCNGKIAQSGGYYFRYLDEENVEVTTADIDTLKLKIYDELCNVKRRYVSRNKMKIKYSKPYKNN